jgi:hypothetical protein
MSVLARVPVLFTGRARHELRQVLLGHVIDDLKERRALQYLFGRLPAVQDRGNVRR